MKQRELTGKDLAAKEKSLAEYAGVDKVIEAKELQQIVNTQGAMCVHINSDYPTLDRYIEGFEAGELIEVSGTTGSGKTLFSQSLTRNVARQGYGICWFTFEMTSRQFFRCFPDLPIFYMPMKLEGANVNWLEDRCWESILKYDVKVIMVDHLHYLFDMARVRNSSLEIGDLVRFLKRMCVNHNIIMVLMCHMTKIPHGQEPGMEHIRDSGLIICEADTILIINRTENKLDRINEATLKIDKARRTGEYPRTFLLKKIGGYLEELKLEEFDND